MQRKRIEVKAIDRGATSRAKMAAITCTVLAGLIASAASPGADRGPEGASVAAEAVAPPGNGTGVAQATELQRIRDAVAQAERQRRAMLEPDDVIPDPAIRQELAERWGVEIYGVRQATGGMMIDFRFRVLDAAKAEPLFDSRNKAYLVKEGAEIRLPVPVGAKVGAFRPTNRGKNIVSDRDYYMMFANPGSYVQPGQKVSVVIGDFKVDGLALN